MEYVLKPCPICGGEAKLITASEDKRRQTNKIECTNKPCIEITRGAMFSVDDIVKIWNRRKAEPIIDAAKEVVAWMHNSYEQHGAIIKLSEAVVAYGRK